MAGTLSIDTLQNGAGASIPATTIINGSAKAWCYFDGTVASGAPTRAFNVSSYTRTATGVWTLNFTTSLPVAQYCALATSNAAGGSWAARAGVVVMSSTQCDLFMSQAGGTAANGQMSFAAFA